MRAGWRLALDLPADLARVRELAESMPGICRALLASECIDRAQMEEAAAPEAMVRMLPSGDGLLRSFFDTTVDETARLWLSRERRRRTESMLEGGDLWLAEVALKLAASGNPPMAWLRALGEKRPVVEGPAHDVEAFHRAIWEWLGEIGQGTPAGAFRTCFRLVPPEDTGCARPALNAGHADSAPAGTGEAGETGGIGGIDEAAETGAMHANSGNARADRGPAAGRPLPLRRGRREEPSSQEPSPGDDIWVVEYLLQAVDDPSLVVPAAKVWREKGRALEFLGRRFENPQERLLADLGRASRVFPAIEDSLKLARPEACYLTTAEAYSFLREVAPLLEESGFGILAPPWWDRTKGRAARLGVRLRVRGASMASMASSASSAPGAAPGESRFGLDSLVEYDWQVALGDQVMGKDEFRRLVALKVPLVRVRGEWVEIRPEDVDAAIEFWDKRRKAGTATLGQALATALQAGSGDGELGLPVVGVDADGWVAGLIQRFSDGGERIQELPAPREFAGSLRPYQVRGYSWLSFLKEWGIGACLADDMGLGKTIQVIALVLRAKEDGALGAPVLLVCPTSVVGNWCRELERFAPSLRVMVHHGVDRLSGARFAAEAAAHDVVITTYSLVYRDEKHLRGLDWHGIVLDEAQNIKNPGTRQSRSVRRLKAGFRAALTGTPIENRLSELWSIMDFLNPGYLGPAADFRRKFALPIERYRDQERAERLRRLVGPFILRRLKTDPRVIQDLPEKQEMKVYCTLTREQATLYEAVVKDMLERIEGTSGMERRGAILAALLKLKQVCNHPAQFLRDRSALDGRSGKLARLVEMLDEVVAEGNRALVFSQFAEMGAMLRDYLRGALGREVVFLHGGVPQKARDEMVQRFQADPDGPPVFVLSLKAGGFGLNLTRANYVFHFDRWWNPAVENQATDRVFRIGQTQKVQVYKFICSGTLEERIDGMIESKKFLADNVIGTGEDWITEMSADELRDLLLLRGEALADADSDGD
ncbi:MAG: DEAD/DEAH box helicase [Anaerolineae bacterium]|nr:DEAD/DEAH box helicase [Anaerolineae bacterium]